MRRDGMSRRPSGDDTWESIPCKCRSRDPRDSRPFARSSRATVSVASPIGIERAEVARAEVAREVARASDD